MRLSSYLGDSGCCRVGRGNVLLSIPITAVVPCVGLNGLRVSSKTQPTSMQAKISDIVVKTDMKSLQNYYIVIKACS